MTPFSGYTWTGVPLRTAQGMNRGIIYLDNDVLALQLVLSFVLPITQLHLNSERPR